ncbi:SagB/ThcOx family dehydrogenase [Methylomicrobium sp. Wu6]|uniref:SagB/ThcOx family dehydrogenase n=1 Tax=Methylomicrobium sp. Wu6 TaxID=3107928 RepID=UPI002DD6AB14|nr:SagB/ThcOx family dehydrogenase [Methylomicrobium sp. Wu6]MEC4747402.1 SagB/ThcOx family dehydrogenase [Methylomicrobium sp. Wu6]
MSCVHAAVDAVIAYHERTKHHLSHYAAGPDCLDWADQPNPFRRFTDCEIVSLPAPGALLPVLFADFDQAVNIPAKPFTSQTLGLLLELAFGLAAWKQYGGERWALRCNPSSGNLHPTEAYVVHAEASLLTPGVYHYLSYDHALEKRSEFTANSAGSDLYIALTSIHWREAWKYGERAYRYCQLDIGHALGALRYAAAALGWSLELIAECGDDELAQLLGLDRQADFKELEAESPDLICRVRYRCDATHSPDIKGLLKCAQNAVWHGRAERLSQFHRNHWPIIEEVAQAAHKPWTEEPTNSPAAHRDLPASACTKTATDIIRQRRSAQRFDASTYLPHNDFIRILSAMMLGSRVPFDVWRWPPAVHLLLFVHRVENLAPGVYLLPRTHDAAKSLRAVLSGEFAWQEAAENMAYLPLYRLVAVNCKRVAKTVSCHQDIAGEGAFSLAMLAEFREQVSQEPWSYRRLFWECGLIGQALYLEAEAVGMCGTGIGCFFDDSMHDILGLQDNTFQSLYHFTVGRALEDSRLQTLPAYHHLSQR